MRNKHESEPELDYDSKQKEDSDHNVDLDDNGSKPKGDSDFGKGFAKAGSLKMECSNTETENRASRPHKRMVPSSRCLRSSGSVYNKKPKKECVSRYSQKAGKNVYDLSDLIRGKGHAKPCTKP